MNDIFLDGGDIYLRALNENDIQGNSYSWSNDPIVTKFRNRGIFPNTLEKQEKYYRSLIDSDTDVIFAIIEKVTCQHIGCVRLQGINWVHSSTELGIVIGEKDFWGKGYGKVAWNLITHYGFDFLNLHHIYAVIFKENTASIKSAEASGFRIDGELRDMFFKNGKYHSALFMSVLKNEFIKIQIVK